ncbi:hypothetical protein C0V77_11850 [Emticicia sp. TH156]|nr:hypothetical protein C0V77_11850 [Emticicia sp. TH156]
MGTCFGHPTHLSAYNVFFMVSAWLPLPVRPRRYALAGTPLPVCHYGLKPAYRGRQGRFLLVMGR